jgi:hypothetical protein
MLERLNASIGEHKLKNSPFFLLILRNKQLKHGEY